jgi:hypothetical protein
VLDHLADAEIFEEIAGICLAHACDQLTFDEGKLLSPALQPTTGRTGRARRLWT